LTVDFKAVSEGESFGDVFLEGSAKLVFEGTIVEI